MVFGVSRDNMASHDKFKAEPGAALRLIADTEEKLCHMFGVVRTRSCTARRSGHRALHLPDRPEGVLRAPNGAASRSPVTSTRCSKAVKLLKKSRIGLPTAGLGACASPVPKWVHANPEPHSRREAAQLCGFFLVSLMPCPNRCQAFSSDPRRSLAARQSAPKPSRRSPARRKRRGQQRTELQAPRSGSAMPPTPSSNCPGQRWSTPPAPAAMRLAARPAETSGARRRAGCALVMAEARAAKCASTGGRPSCSC